MKKVFLLMVTSALLVSLGFAQTPPAGSSTDQVNVKGCLGGSDGNYTVAEDGTRQIFKITTSAVALKPHLGHDVELIGQKASWIPSAGAADNSFAVTGLNMISEHCAAAAAAAPTTVSPASPAPSAPAASPASPVVGTPPADAAVPAETPSPASVTVAAPAATAAPPVAPASPSPATVSTPAAADAVAPSPSSPIIITEAADDAHATRLSSHHRRSSATPAAAATVPDATVTPSSDTVTPPAATAATPAATASPSPQTASAAVAATPAVTQKGWSLPLLISAVVVIVVLGTLAPLFGRWRRRKMLEKTGTPNLSFTKEASTDEVTFDQDKPEPRKVA
jgi:hypothetical protein